MEDSTHCVSFIIHCSIWWFNGKLLQLSSYYIYSYNTYRYNPHDMKVWK